MFCFSNCSLKESNVFLLPIDWNQTLLSSLIPTPKITSNHLWISLGLHSVRMIRQEWENSVLTVFANISSGQLIINEDETRYMYWSAFPLGQENKCVKRTTLILTLLMLIISYVSVKSCKTNKKINLKQIYLFNRWIFSAACPCLLACSSSKSRCEFINKY